MVNNNDFEENEISEFLKISSILGKNKHLIQGAGGNTSIKNNNNLFIKASGTCLKDSRDKNIFLETNLDNIRNKIERNIDDNFISDVISNSDFRPSIETSLHALIEHKYVLHVHSISSLANIIYEDSFSILRNQLKENFCYVPYARPGMPLTIEIRKKINESNQNIIFLENHGLIISDDNLIKAFDLLNKIHNNLDKVLFEEDIINKSVFDNKIKHYNYLDDSKFDIFKSQNNDLYNIFSKSFYPDHVIFLGPGLPCFENYKEANIFIEKLNFNNISIPPYLIIKSIGLFVSEKSNSISLEMLECFVEFLKRFNLSKNYKYLSNKQENELLNWDAEKYRQSIN